MQRPKVIVVLGPTTSGKTKLAVKLANQFSGEIISADSRQVYRGMDIGTGKDLKEYGKVPYHLIDVAVPKSQFTVADFQRLANWAIKDIIKKGNLPIISGGTGLYISSLVEGYILPESNQASDKEQVVRSRFEKLSLKQLLDRLKKVDPATYKVIDKKNRRRVQRALEIYYLVGPKSKLIKKKAPDFEFLQIGIKVDQKKLDQRIKLRLRQRMKQGMIAEVKRLRKQGVSWQRLENFGLEYAWVSRYLQGQLTKKEMVEKLETAIRQFSKRQMTWFKRDKSIRWVKSRVEAKSLVRNFFK